MILNRIKLVSSGLEIGSGVGEAVAIRRCVLTESVNAGQELTLGSTCCACLEAELIVSEGELQISAGEKVELWRSVDGKEAVQVGVFTAEKPVRTGQHSFKLTAYDHVAKLDKDLSTWLAGLKGWPYTLGNFAKLVCQACGVTLASADFPNKDFSVIQFHRPQVTGRQLMQWIGELACRFCRARADGMLELGWYSSAGKTITPTGKWYIFGGSLSYGDYDVMPIDAVKLRLANSDSGALWPDGEAENPYILQGNPLIAGTTPTVETALATIQEQLSNLPSYRAGKVSIPAGMDIRAGHTVNVIDANNKHLTLCVMTKTNSGQRDTLECTGSANRSSSTAVNNPTTQQVAQQTVAAMTHEEVFNKLTNNGAIQGIYVQDGKWYINAELAKIINLTAESIDTANLKVAAANVTGKLTATQIDATNLSVSAANITGKLTAGQIDATGLTVSSVKVVDSDNATLFSAGNGKVSIAGWRVDSNSLYLGSSFQTADCFLCTGSVASMSIGGSDSISGWVFKAGSKFGVTKTGVLYANDVHLTGVINADNGGTIGDWIIKDKALYSELSDGSIIALYPTHLQYTYGEEMMSKPIPWDKIADFLYEKCVMNS